MAQLTLSDEEVRNALAEALKEKMRHTCEFDPDECYFTVMSASGEVEDIEEVKFTGPLGE